MNMWFKTPPPPPQPQYNNPSATGLRVDSNPYYDIAPPLPPPWLDLVP